MNVISEHIADFENAKEYPAQVQYCTEFVGLCRQVALTLTPPPTCLATPSPMANKSPSRVNAKSSVQAPQNLPDLSLSADHKLFLCEFDNDLRALRAKTPLGTQVRLRAFVDEKVVPRFLASKGIPNETLKDKIYQFVKNRANRQAKTAEPRASPSPGTGNSEPSDTIRAQSVRNLVARDFRDAIRKGLGATSKNIGDWNQALTDFIEGLSSDDLRAYEAMSSQSKKDWAKPLTQKSMFESQAALPGAGADALRKLLGWDNKRQYGDGLFFLSSAFRNSMNEVVVKRFIVCNVPGFMTLSGPLVTAFDTNIASEFTKLAASCLPLHPDHPDTSFVEVSLDRQVTLGTFNINELTIGQLVKIYREFVTNVWVMSDTGRAPETVPWSELENFRESPDVVEVEGLMGAITNLNPETMSSEQVIPILKAIQEGSASLFFKKNKNIDWEEGTRSTSMTRAMTPVEATTKDPVIPADDLGDGRPDRLVPAVIDSLTQDHAPLTAPENKDVPSAASLVPPPLAKQKRQRMPKAVLSPSKRRSSTRESKKPEPIVAKVKKGHEEERKKPSYTYVPRSPISEEKKNSRKRGRAASTSDETSSRPSKVKNAN
ncbi:hypothetical protein NP233_g12149 [Leucocoprinus birnbaumii]|uniref:Uncharacterized protein n=1 Tax=Leucocoprinus birnbaumii TaxID=56174 RepID=A0AAD5VG79_9AGAR|nr:hypothetical protein NP233_g12149 [Leucocoprinus birnbaumii]